MRKSYFAPVAGLIAVFVAVAPCEASAQTCPDGSFPVEGRCPAQACPDGSFPVQGRCGVESATAGPAPDYGTHMDEGLIIAGSVTLGVGWLTSSVFGIIGSNPILFIPLAGGAIHAPVNGTGGGIALGVSVSGVQLVGLIILIAGLAHHHPNAPPRASLLPELVPGPGQAGLGARWRF